VVWGKHAGSADDGGRVRCLRARYQKGEEEAPEGGGRNEIRGGWCVGSKGEV